MSTLANKQCSTLILRKSLLICAAEYNYSFPEESLKLCNSPFETCWRIISGFITVSPVGGHEEHAFS